jgi:phosphatidylserine synthase
VLIAAVAAALCWTVAVNLQESPGSFAGWVEFIAATTTGIFILTGVIAIHRSKLTAFRWFRRALLISILVTQVFTFYQYQFVALGALAVNLLLFAAIRYMISEEEAEAALG